MRWFQGQSRISPAAEPTGQLSSAPPDRSTLDRISWIGREGINADSPGGAYVSQQAGRWNPTVPFERSARLPGHPHELQE